MFANNSHLLQVGVPREQRPGERRVAMVLHDISRFVARCRRGRRDRLDRQSDTSRSKTRSRRNPMKWLAQLVAAAAVLTTPLAASAQSLTEAQARAVIAPWYSLFNQPVQGDMKMLQEQVLTADYESCWGYLPGECWGRDASIKVVGGFAKSIPDMKFEIKEVLVAGERVIVRGEVTGTPAGDLFGVPHSGKSFRIMAIDIQTVRDGKIARTYHLENWLSALGQLRAK
jgi:ketosteroid isomerase-like protein